MNPKTDWRWEAVIFTLTLSGIIASLIVLLSGCSSPIQPPKPVPAAIVGANLALGGVSEVPTNALPVQVRSMTAPAPPPFPTALVVRTNPCPTCPPRPNPPLVIGVDIPIQMVPYAANGQLQGSSDNLKTWKPIPVWLTVSNKPQFVMTFALGGGGILHVTNLFATNGPKMDYRVFISQ